VRTVNEWRYFDKGAKFVIVMYVTAYCVATGTHSLDLVTKGMYRVQSIPSWINWFWLSLTLIDPLSVIAILAWPPAGIVAMMVVIYADVAINAFVSLQLAGPRALLSLFFVCQFGFLLFITLTSRYAWRWVTRTRIAETERLYLRPLRSGDYRALAKILTDPESMRWYPRPLTVAETKEWIRRNLRRYRRDGLGLWAVILKENGRCMGDCGVTWQEIDGDVVPEIGFHIEPSSRGKGYAPEAASAAIEYVAREYGIKKIYSYCEVGNGASRRVMEKVGLRFEKEYVTQSATKVVYAKSLP